MESDDDSQEGLIIYTLSHRLHPYYQVDYSHNRRYYQKFIEDKNGEKYKKYDFDITNKRIFLGNNHLCFYAKVKDNIAEIEAYTCENTKPEYNYFEYGKKARYLFLLFIKLIKIYFPYVKEINVLDECFITANKEKFMISIYYFMKYGKPYYEFYFGIKPKFYSEYNKKKYQKNIQKQKNIFISQKLLKKYIKEYFQNNPNNPYKSLKSLFANNKKIQFSYFLQNIPPIIQNNFSNFFIFLIDCFFRNNCNDFLLQKYQIKNI